MLSKKELERLERLRRRRDWLVERASKAVVNEDKELSFDNAEASALSWAIEKIENMTDR